MLTRFETDARISGLAAAVVLVCFYAVLLASLRDKSATFDEPGHATAGYIYWKHADYRIDPENGILSKRWIALPYLRGKEPFPPLDSPGWAQSNTWLLADTWFNRLGHDPQSMLARGRAMSGLVAVALGAMVWWWARRLVGPEGGLIALLLYVLNPAILAHGALMTSDVPATLGFLASLACMWLVLERITPARVLLGTAAMAGLFLAKMSAVLLLPMAALLAVARLVDGRPLPLGSRRMLVRRSHQAFALTIVAVVQAAGVVALVWAAYGFRYSAFSPTAPAPQVFHDPWEWEFDLPPPRAMLAELKLDAAQQRQVEALRGPNPRREAEWTNDSYALMAEIRRRVLTADQSVRLDQMMQAPPPGWAPRLIHFLREQRLLPEAFLYGYAHVRKSSGARAGFLNGEIRNTGWWYFFPFTFAVKTPLALLGLVALALAAGVVRIRRRLESTGEPHPRALWALAWPWMPLAVLCLVYGAFAIASNLNIGHRHLLPIYPPLCILGAAGVRSFRPTVNAPESSPPRPPWSRFAGAGLLFLLFVESALWFPHHLAYFNGLVSPARAYQHLVDSSLDWGQDLPAIARYLKARPEQPAYLAFFGVGSPAAYGIRARLIGGFPNLDWKLLPPMKLLSGKTPAELIAFFRDHPDYDPGFILRLEGTERPGVLALQRSSAFRLGPGLYVISASMLQPLYHGKVSGYWDRATEETYQRLRQAIRPFLADDLQAKEAALRARSVPAWIEVVDDYFDFRLARLNTFLRRRAPDAMINHSVLVYQLTEQDLAEALEGPAP